MIHLADLPPAAPPHPRKPQIKMSGEEVIPEDPGDVIVPDSNRTIHPDHRGHTGGDSLTIQAQEVLAEGAIARRRLLLRRRR